MNDGAVLLPVPDEIPLSDRNIPTVVLTPTPQPRGGPAPWIYLIGGAMGAVVIIGGIYLFLRGADNTANEKFVSVAKSPELRTPVVTPAGNINANRTVEPTPSPAAISPKGHWTGDWSSPSGAYLTIVVDLNDDGAGGITGRIEWTLRRTNRPDKKSKIGMSATEYVSGTFDPGTRVLSMKGYRKDDPDNVLVMVDTYRLDLSGNTLKGKALNGGKWDGSVNLSR
jgi:hypothetical protein